MFEAALRDPEGEEQVDFLVMLVDELTKASDEDGIGMYSDDEWQYYQVQEKIQDYLDSLS